MDNINYETICGKPGVQVKICDVMVKICCIALGKDSCCLNLKLIKNCLTTFSVRQRLDAYMRREGREDEGI